MKKVKWTVSPAPTGPFRSFVRRHWPTGVLTADPEGRHHFLIYSVDDRDEYVPAKVKTGDYGPLRLLLDIVDPDSETGYTRVRMKSHFRTLEELKAHVEMFVTERPHLFKSSDK